MLFLGLGYALRETTLAIDRTTAVAAFVVIGLVAAGGVTADLIGPEPTYTASFEEEVRVDADQPWEDVQVGTLTVENEFALSRTFEPPTYTACAYTADGHHLWTHEDAWESTRGWDAVDDTVLSGGESITVPLSVSPDLFVDHEDFELHDDFADAETIPVETAESCPERTDGVTIVVYER